jgi:putative restriction endonuclease
MSYGAGLAAMNMVPMAQTFGCVGALVMIGEYQGWHIEQGGEPVIEPRHRPDRAWTTQRVAQLMSNGDLDSLLRTAVFEHVRMLTSAHAHLTATELTPGFNPQRGIFKPQQMRFLVSIRTGFPRTGRKVWYDDQRAVHRQIFEGDEAIDYAFMGDNPNAADNRWLLEAYENATPVIYFLGVAPDCYQAVLPIFISDWNATTLKASVIFGTPDETVLTPPQDSLERRYALRAVKQRLHQASP